MNQVILHTEYLLRTTDCVSIPGFGAFIAQYEPAHYDYERHLYIPPSRGFVFNPSISHNDGLIACSISRKDGIDCDSANRIIAAEVEAMKAHLADVGELTFGSIGHFVCRQDRYLFTPEETKSYLTPINILPCGDVDKESGIDTDHPFRLTFPNKLLRIAASIVVLFVLGLVLSTPISVEHSTIAYAKAMPEISSPKKVEIVDSIAVELNIAIPDAPDATGIYIQPSAIQDSHRYGLVVASLANASQAEQYIAQHPGKDLRIIRIQGRIRVIAASADNLDELLAIAAEKEFSAEFPQSWACRK